MQKVVLLLVHISLAQAVRSHAVKQNEASWTVYVLLNGHVLPVNDQGHQRENLAQNVAGVE